MRPIKAFRLSYVKTDPDMNPTVQVMGAPSEVRLSTSPKVFMSVREDGITLSPGLGGQINLQGLSHNMRYGGLLMDLPFPLTLIPSTPFTPFPKQVFNPPLAKIVGFLADTSTILSSLVL